MKMRRSFSAFFFMALFSFRFLSFAQDVHFTSVTLPPEDAGSVILGMTQDTQRFLWLATQNGLYKYDGYQYISYHNEPLNSNSLASNYIECIAADKAGNIWLAIRGVGVDRLDPATGIFTHFPYNKNNPGSLSSDTVNVIMPDHEGTIWIGSFNGLDRFDNKTNSFFHYRHNKTDPTSLSCNIVKAIYEDKQGTIWVGTGSTWSQNNFESAGGLNKLNRKQESL